MVRTLPVTTVIINYKTLDLVQRAVESFRHYYPDIFLLLIDNGSFDPSTSFLKDQKNSFPQNTDLIINEKNIHHGPAMDQALHYVHTSHVLFLDSDCEIRKGGFVELMFELLEKNSHNYIVGKKIYMNKRGFDVVEQEQTIPYIRPICMLVRREIYLSLPKFTRHGTPCLTNMSAAVRSGFNLVHFSIEDYIFHLGRGTASRYGYKLGLKGKINYLLNKLGL